MRSKKAIYNIITNLLLQIVAIVYGFVVPKVIINYFGSDVNGLIVSITQFLMYISLLESGFGPVVKATLYKPIVKKDKESIAGILKTSEVFFRRIALVFILYIAILCVIFPLFISNNFDSIFIISLVIIISASIFAEYYFGITYRLFLEAEQKTYIISTLQIVTYILSTIVIIVLALAGANVLMIKLATCAVFILRPIVQNYYIKRKYNISLKDAPNGYRIKQKWDGFAQHIAAVIHNNTDVVVLTLFTSLPEVSVYSVYSLVTVGVKKLIQPLTNSFDSLFGDMMAREEDENLKKKFSTYELLYMVFITILFTCTLLLIVPFVRVYTSGVTDTDYIRPVFGYLLVISEFLWAVRAPFSVLIFAAGHFKETRRGAWVEAGINILLSILLVFNFGIIGVAIGTIVAMFVRTVEFVFYANRKIIRRSILESTKKIIISILIMVIVATIGNLVFDYAINSFVEWAMKAIVVVLLASSVTILFYGIIYRRDMALVLRVGKNLIRKVKKKCLALSVKKKK